MTAPGEIGSRIERLAVGKVTPRWAVCVALLVLLAGWGVYAYSLELGHGMISSGLRTIGRGGATWGLYIIFAVYFIGLSFAGVSIAALVRLFDLEDLRPLARIAELLTIISLLMGGLCILADLGRPLQGMSYLPRYARPLSPFFGTFTLVVSGYLFASLVYLYLAGRADAAACARHFPKFRWAYQVWASGCRGSGEEYRRHVRVSFWLSLLILPMLVAAHSTLGFVFGIQGGRPGWFSALQAPSFVVLAGASGLGMLIIMAAAVRKSLALEAVITTRSLRLLGNLQWTLTMVYLYFMLVEEITASYAAATADARVAHEIVFGAYAWMFWTTVACFAIPTSILFLQFVRDATHVGWAVASAALVNVGAILKRFLIVVPSQTHGSLLPYPPGSYVPSWVEISVVLGLFAIAGMLFLVFSKFFPIVPVVTRERYAATSEAVFVTPWERGSRILRSAIFWTTLVVGVALAVAGFLLSLRVGTLPYLDPVLPYSPVVFIAGVMLTFYSAAAYETLPPTRGRLREDTF